LKINKMKSPPRKPLEMKRKERHTNYKSKSKTPIPKIPKNFCSKWK